jgi:hypothetical protein
METRGNKVNSKRIIKNLKLYFFKDPNSSVILTWFCMLPFFSYLFTAHFIIPTAQIKSHIKRSF